MAEKDINFELLIQNGQGSISTEQATFGTTLSGSISITHDLHRICPPMAGDPEELWEVNLYIDNELVKSESEIENEQEIQFKDIKTKLLGDTQFRIELKFSQQWNMKAEVNLKLFF